MIAVTIGGTDRTGLIEYSSLKITQILTHEPDRCEFIVRKFGSRSFAPTVNQEVTVTQDGTKIFGGRIIEVEEVYDKLDLISYRVRCVDYTRDLDNRLIVETYENQSVVDIITHIKNNYLQNAITISNVNAPGTIQKIRFNYEYPSEALRQLAEIVQADWYVDYDKDIHFNAQGSVSAGFGLTDTGGKYIYDSLVVRKDLSQLRNVVFVRGGEFLGNTTTVEFLGDGTQRTFFLPYKFSNLTATVTGQEKNIGIDPIDSETDYDGLHNFQEKFVRFRTDKTPTNTSAVRIGGTPHLPVLAKVRDTESEETFTTREIVIIDKSISSKEAARQRAIAEIVAYRTTVSEGEFKTYQTSLHVGETINVQSDLRSIDDDFIINKIEMRVFGTDASDRSQYFISTISLMTTRTFDYIRLLKHLLNTKLKDLVIDDNEILDEVEAIQEEVAITEVISSSLSHNPISESVTLTETEFTANKDYGEVYVAGPWTSGFEEDTPSSRKRQFITNGSRAG